jgi:hypothetical protein
MSQPWTIYESPLGPLTLVDGSDPSVPVLPGSQRPP